jgi:hypothetical protein
VTKKILDLTHKKSSTKNKAEETLERYRRYRLHKIRKEGVNEDGEALVRRRGIVVN